MSSINKNPCLWMLSSQGGKQEEDTPTLGFSIQETGQVCARATQTNRRRNSVRLAWLLYSHALLESHVHSVSLSSVPWGLATPPFQTEPAADVSGLTAQWSGTLWGAHTSSPPLRHHCRASYNLHSIALPGAMVGTVLALSHGDQVPQAAGIGEEAKVLSSVEA
jgi:hypothetical protein